MRSRKWAGLLCAALMVSMLGGCGQKPDANAPQEPEAVVGVPVEVAAVGTQDFERTISVAGKTAAESTVNVIAKVSGMEQIMAVNVKVGDKVSKGQVLASLNTDSTSLQMDQAQLAYDNAKDMYE